MEAITIQNEYGHKITPSQQKWLDKFIEQYKDKIICVWMTKGGYLLVDHKRHSKEYPYGRQIRGRAAGFITTMIGKDYDYEHGWILDGIKTDHVFGTENFGLE